MHLKITFLSVMSRCLHSQTSPALEKGPFAEKMHYGAHITSKLESDTGAVRVTGSTHCQTPGAWPWSSFQEGVWSMMGARRSLAARCAAFLYALCGLVCG